MAGSNGFFAVPDGPSSASTRSGAQPVPKLIADQNVAVPPKNYHAPRFSLSPSIGNFSSSFKSAAAIPPVRGYPFATGQVALSNTALVPSSWIYS
jgi:hypothetical protein